MNVAVQVLGCRSRSINADCLWFPSTEVQSKLAVCLSKYCKGVASCELYVYIDLYGYLHPSASSDYIHEFSCPRSLNEFGIHDKSM